jgi:hypothetical protein
MDNERKTLFFVGLPQGDVYNCQLERHVGVQVIVQCDNEVLDNYSGDKLF